MPSQPVLSPEPAQLCKSEQHPSSLPIGPVLATLGHHQTPTPNSTGSGHSPPSSSLTPPSHVNLSPNTARGFSYSSSEDEFYDTDEFHQSSSSPKCLIHSSGSASVLTHSSLGNSLKLPDTTESLNSSMSNGTSDADLFDSHVDRDDNREAGPVEEHRSVIMHLSQVRLGMDLTKVVLPTFLLERSLLEMYADFFAHPDLFVSISDQKDPRDQMVQVVKWYLSAFHAGRKRSVAKKPYNPILGEIFQCHWVLPNDTEENTELVSEGPIPWISKNSVTFMAEQVSHHPPISAFYAECFNKKIQFSAHIWTKSKFLAMSIGVYNIGQNCVSCLDYDEHYILTFPNGYGRSILTVPWVELGECSIDPKQTI
ncbi:Oxysterol-binding protein-related protein 9 [Heterocephalus glaber]|uniref:Oxysterol-binding protein n=1 Tax=Heterocephalus glaber TaxID=10181 RepID=G5B4J2_HETGA|nr:Oxysterol-binding protein-related protein 9 [Heterocephalus glaber]